MPDRIAPDADVSAENDLTIAEDPFEQIQARLAPMYATTFPDPLAPRTVVVVPSLSMHPEELAKIDGVHHYEERMLFLLMLLRLPRTHIIYVTSQPIHPSIIDYFLHLLPGVPSRHARNRLTMLSCYDASPIALTQKILQRDRLIERIKDAIVDKRTAHMTCFNSTDLERELARRLEIPLYATDPDLVHFGSKSSSRNIFRMVGLDLPDGVEDLVTERDIVDALVTLKRRDPTLQKAVVKLNEGFSGEGNALFSFTDCPANRLEEWVREELPKRLRFEAGSETWERFLHKFDEMGGVVEAWVDGNHKRSPSVQCRINPVGEVEVVSTHEQLLGGPSVQVYLGCTFPAHDDYRLELQEAGYKVGRWLSRHGIIGRFSIDFISVKKNGVWRHYAIEINLRKGGTTHPYMMLQFLTGGTYDIESGEFYTVNGKVCQYYASDNVVNANYVGMMPDDLIDMSVFHGLHFDSLQQEGVVFHLIGALSEFGKLGVLCIGRNLETARDFYDQTIAALDSWAAK